MRITLDRSGWSTIAAHSIVALQGDRGQSAGANLTKNGVIQRETGRGGVSAAMTVQVPGELPVTSVHAAATDRGPLPRTEVGQVFAIGMTDPRASQW